MKSINSLYHSEETKRYLRILHFDNLLKKVVYIIFDESGHAAEMPETINENILDEFLRAQNYFLQEQDPFYILLDEDNISEKELERINSRYEEFKPYINNIPRIYAKTGRSKLLKALRQKYSDPFIYMTLKTFWVKRMSKAAFATSYKNCGTNRRFNDQFKQLGRPKKQGRPSMNMTPDDIDKILKGYKKYYLNCSYPTTKYAAYKFTISDYFSSRDSNGKIVKNKIRPSREQWNYYIGKNFTKDEIKKKKDEHNYFNNCKPTHGTVHDIAYYPNHVHMIDSSPSPFQVCTSDEKPEKIGNAEFYLVVDVFSRTILGYTVSIHNRSYLTGNLALLSAYSKKNGPNQINNLNILDEEWPCYHYPETLIADCAEYDTFLSDSIIEYLGIKIQNSQAYRPYMKSIVERLFSTIKEKISMYLKGQSLKLKRSKKFTPNHLKKKAITLELLNQLTALAIIEYNNHHVIDKFEPTQEMLLENVPPTPIKIWNLYKSDYDFYNRENTFENTWIRMLPTKLKSATRLGILYERGVRYIPESKEGFDLYKLEISAGKDEFKVFFDARYNNKKYILLNDKFYKLKPKNRAFPEFESEYEMLYRLEKYQQNNNLYKEEEEDRDIDAINELKELELIQDLGVNNPKTNPDEKNVAMIDEIKRVRSKTAPDDFEEDDDSDLSMFNYPEL